MYAIVDIAGQQFKVKKDQNLKVHRLDVAEGKVLELDQVLLVSDGAQVSVGAPRVEGVRVAAQVLGHSKGDKVLVFHKHRRKGYSKLNGHRQALTELRVLAILAKGEAVPAAVAVRKPKETNPVGTKVAAKKKAAVAEPKAKAKKAPAKKKSAPKAAK
jgi:large subunit ribosomal protein L21